MPWSRFIRLYALCLLLLAGLVYAFILLVDPYEDVPFSLPIPRAPISQNQRYAYPALARREMFDSAVIGTSTMRLLDPDRLNQLLPARFVNLAMNSATAYEQFRIHELFVRHHPQANYILLGIDDSWCRRDDAAEHYTFRAFPEWMFDENRWNDLLYLFNDKALENAVRMLEYALGARTAKYQTNGYFDFTQDMGRYDLAAVRKRLYAGAAGGDPGRLTVPDLTPTHAHPDWRFGSLVYLERIVAQTPAATRTAIIFVPFHGYHLQTNAETYAECKGRVARIVAGHANIRLLDFMIDSDITHADRNYWDPLHTTAATARKLERDIAQELLDASKPDSHYRRLQ